MLDVPLNFLLIRIELWAVVNNAGILKGFSLEFSSVDDFRDCIDVNLLGYVRVTKAFLPLLRQTKGRIVNVTSIAVTAINSPCDKDAQVDSNDRPPTYLNTGAITQQNCPIKIDIHGKAVPHHLEGFAEDGSSFKLIHLGGSFTGRTATTANPSPMGTLIPSCLLFSPLSKRIPQPYFSKLTPTHTPSRVAFAFVRETRSPSLKSYFSFMTECAKWKTNNIGFPNLSPVYINSHRIFALTKSFGVMYARWSGTAFS
ncbi:hypothetical protein AVEN_208342-1 [Araneus ventricosus]|uniref:Uncharacterized protein n=1 Tax=Araneus ventricosus TaxID=182803 RepID=A0A4Y2FCD5_ARAVE|nr:hypothetical protein AVEN_208342-1 [Araneus ventricosus]